MSLASAAAHVHSPFPLPAVPRIRPPPIPKGTPGPNTKPIPSEVPHSQEVWADGKWRYKASNAAKHKSEVVSRQLEKALRNEVNGMNIYAYRNFRTNQVVYSLTKNMDNTKILKQLLFHGKQTVPRALRRDIWRPYFSLHFPKTPAGARKGLQVFQELRELSIQRQLDPPLDMVIATEKDINMIKRKYTSAGLKEALEKDITKRGVKYEKLDMPVAGMRLPRKMIARRLMNQRATSVADVAAVLKRHVTATAPKWGSAANMPQQDPEEVSEERTDQTSEPILQSPKELLERREAWRKERELGLSTRAFNRLQKIRGSEAAKSEELENRKEYIKPRPGYAQLQKYTIGRLSMEYEGLVYVPNEGMDLRMIEEARETTKNEDACQKALLSALEQIKKEKELERDTIERQVSAQIDQRLADMSESERTQVQREITDEKARKQAQVDAKIAEIESEMRTRIERRHLRMTKSDEPRKLAAFRRFKRELAGQLENMKATEQRGIKWLGPYAEIDDRIEEALKKIDARWGSKLGRLRKAITNEERIKEGNESAEVISGDGVRNPVDMKGHEVEIRWADLRDGTYAREWPDSVFHGELQPRAVVKKPKTVVREYAYVDDMEYDISQQSQSIEVPIGTSVHVFGAEEMGEPSESRWQSPQYLAVQSAKLRQERALKWSQTELILTRRRIIMWRAENDKLKPYFADSTFDSEQMPNLAIVVARFDQAMEHYQYLEPDTYGSSDVEDIEFYLNLITSEALLKAARQEVQNSPNSDADTTRLDWLINSANLMKLECQFPEAKFQADLRQKYQDKFDERIQLLKDIALDKPGAEASLEQFDEVYSLAKEVMQRYETDPTTLTDLFTDAEQTRLAQQQVLRECESAEQAARSALFEVEAKHPSIDGSDPEPVRNAKKLLQTAKRELEAAHQAIANIRDQRIDVIEEIQDQMGAVKDDEDGWKVFRESKGEIGLSSSRARMTDETSSDAVQQSQDVVVPQQQGIWARVKGLLGRK